MSGTATSKYIQSEFNFLSNPTGSNADGSRLTGIKFGGIKTDLTSGSLGLIEVSHQGTGDDFNGQLDFYVNNGTNPALPGSITAAVSITPAAITLTAPDIIVSGNLQLSDLTLQGFLKVYGSTTLSSTLSVQDNALFLASCKVNGMLEVVQSGTIRGDLVVSSAMTVGGAFSALNSGTFNGDLRVVQNATVNGNEVVSGNLTVGLSSTINGDLLDKGAFQVYGASTLSNTLTVAQTGSFNAGVLVSTTLQVGGNATVLKNANISGNMQISGTLNVDGNSTLNNFVNVKGTSNQLQMNNQVIADFTGSNTNIASGAIAANLYIDHNNGGFNGGLYFGTPNVLNTLRLIMVTALVQGNVELGLAIQMFDGTKYNTMNAFTMVTY